jgi:hypothetical protein
VVATLENAAGKQYPDAADWVVEFREEERRQVVLMIDTSGSMAGEPMALASVAAAVLALKVAPWDLGIVTFADDARDVVLLGERIPPEEMVRRLLDQPCRGSTNIEAALAAGERQLGRASDPRRAGVLVSDGQFTAGNNPRPVAGRFTSTSCTRRPPRPAGRPPGSTRTARWARISPGSATARWCRSRASRSCRARCSASATCCCAEPRRPPSAGAARGGVVRQLCFLHRILRVIT